MRFDSGKIWPHPVLRPSQYGDDYPFSGFEVDIEVRRTAKSTAVDLEAMFILSDPDLLNLVKDGFALYVLLIRSSKTHFRSVIKSKSEEIKSSFSAGELSGRVEFTPLLVCVKDILGFHADGWHDDFAGYSFDIKSGMILAEDESKDYWIDKAEETPIGSIFQCISSADIPSGYWQCNLEGNRIKIMLSEYDYSRFDLARSRVHNRLEGQYLMNGLYLPVLIWVLAESDRNNSDYEEYRWFSSLNDRLQKVGCKALGGEDSSDRSVDAQKIFEYPFVKMPMIANMEDDI